MSGDWRDNIDVAEAAFSFCVIRSEAKPRGREGFFVIARDIEQARRKVAILWPGESVRIEYWGDRK